MDRIAKRKALVTLLAYKLTRERRWWVRPIFQNRKSQGATENLIKEMRLSDTESFFNFFRMSPTQFDLLLSLVGPSISKQDTNYRESIQPDHRLALTLRFLASGDLMSSLAYSFRVGRSTVSCIIRDTCKALSSALKPLVLPRPSKEKWLQIAEEFFYQWQFPHCLGAIDGKHVLIQAPSNSGSKYHNYKGGFSIILMASADAHCRFVLVEIGFEGHNSDGGIFGNSNFGQAIKEEYLDFPQAKELPGTTAIHPFVFVADEAFPLRENLLRPYPGVTLTHERRVFNYRLSRARRCVENAFGVMAARFRIFRKAIVASEETCLAIVSAAVCLHNFLKFNEEAVPLLERKYCPPGFEDSAHSDGTFVDGAWRAEDLPGVRRMNRAGSNMYSRKAEAVRSGFKNFLCTHGCLTWHDKYVTDSGRS